MVNATDRLVGLRAPVSGPAVLEATIPMSELPAAAPVDVDTPDDFARVARRRAPTQPRGELPAVDPRRAAALVAEARARTAAAPTADMLRASAADGLTVGDRGRAVRTLERQLRRAGFDTGRVDGVFDARTARAVSRFQSAVAPDSSAPTTGVADASTRRRLAAVDARVREHHGRLLGPGQQSDRILRDERRLARLGYDTGPVDGVYDRQTGEAMRAFRRDQGRKPGSLLAGKPTERALAEESRALAHDPQRVRVRPSRERRAADARVAQAAARRHADGTQGLGEGARSGAVRTMQQHLRAAGYDPKRADGRFDERTRGALEQFQRRSDLPVTGRLDPATWRALRGATLEARDGFHPAQREGERSAAVRRTERALARLGYHPGKVDGLYTAATQRAVDRFRKKEHLGGRGEGVGPRVHGALVKALREQAQHGSLRLGKKLAAAGLDVARSMGGYSGLGLCATGVSRAIARAMGVYVGGNGNQIDNNLPRKHFKEVHMSLAQALRIPGVVLTWERTSTALGQRYGHTAITTGDGHTSVSDFIETNTLAGSRGRSGLRMFVPIR